MKEKPKKKIVSKKKKGARCVCCGSRREEFEREIERILFEGLKRLALIMTNKEKRSTFLALLEDGCDRLLEIDKKPKAVDPNRA